MAIERFGRPSRQSFGRQSLLQPTHSATTAYYPPSDGYQPPVDPLVDVTRQIDVVGQIKTTFPNFLLVGTAYSYLQEFLPHVAQRAVRDGKVDFIGLGRVVLSYPDLPADVLWEGALATHSSHASYLGCDVVSVVRDNEPVSAERGPS